MAGLSTSTTDGLYGSVNRGLWTRTAYQNTYEPGLGTFGTYAAGIAPIPSTSTFQSGYSGGMQTTGLWAAGQTVPEMGGQGLRIAYPQLPQPSLLTDAVSKSTQGGGGGGDNKSNGWGGIGFSVGATVVASLINALGAASASKYLAQGQNAMLEAQAHIAENNAKIFENQAVLAKSACEWQTRKVTAQYGEEKAKMRAGMAANGVAIGAGGTSAEMLASNDIYKALDKRQAAINAVAEAWGYKARASSARNEAWAARAGRGNASGIGLSAGARAFTDTMQPLMEKGLSLSLGR